MKKRVMQDNHRKADNVKQQKLNENVAIPLKTKVYGGFQPEFFEEDRTTAQNSLMNATPQEQHFYTERNVRS
jgi:hypothetical protein